MMTLTLTLEDLTEKEQDLLKHLLLDAFSEFGAHRSPPQAYLDKRYPDVPEYSWLNRPAKLAHIQARIALAAKLHHAVFSMDVDDGTIHSKAEPIWAQCADCFTPVNEPHADWCPQNKAVDLAKDAKDWAEAQDTRFGPDPTDPEYWKDKEDK